MTHLMSRVTGSKELSKSHKRRSGNHHAHLNKGCPQASAAVSFLRQTLSYLIIGNQNASSTIQTSRKLVSESASESLKKYIIPQHAPPILYHRNLLSLVENPVRCEILQLLQVMVLLLI